MLMRLFVAGALALGVSACAMGGGTDSLAYVSDPVEVVSTPRGDMRVVASSNPPGFWVFPDGTRWPMGYAPRSLSTVP